MAFVTCASSPTMPLCLGNDINNGFWKWFKDAWKEKSIHRGMQGWNIWLCVTHYPSPVFLRLLLLLLISLPGAERAALKCLTRVASVGFPMKQLFSFFFFPLRVCGHVIKVSCYIVHLSSTVTPFAQTSCFDFFVFFFLIILPISCVCL